jgi:hypothetical protein
MRLIFSKGIILVLLSGIESNHLNAQSILNKLELGAQAGSLIYQGDLTPERLGAYLTPGFQLGVSAGMRLNYFLSVRADLTFGKLRGNDAKYSSPEWRQHRNLNFKSPVFEIAGLAVWDVMGDPHQRTGISPYVFAGMGVSFLRVQRDASAFDVEYFSAASGVQDGLNTDLARTPPKAVLIFPAAGIGVRYPYTERVSLKAEASYPFSFSDYIDGFSEAGNPDRSDHYHGMSVGIFYRLTGSNALKCPVIRP